MSKVACPLVCCPYLARVPRPPPLCSLDRREAHRSSDAHGARDVPRGCHLPASVVPDHNEVGHRSRGQGLQRRRCRLAFASGVGGRAPSRAHASATGLHVFVCVVVLRHLGLRPGGPSYPLASWPHPPVSSLDALWRRSTPASGAPARAPLEAQSALRSGLPNSSFPGRHPGAPCAPPQAHSWVWRERDETGRWPACESAPGARGGGACAVAPAQTAGGGRTHRGPERYRRATYGQHRGVPFQGVACSRSTKITRRRT